MWATQSSTWLACNIRGWTETIARSSGLSFSTPVACLALQAQFWMDMTEIDSSLMEFLYKKLSDKTQLNSTVH